MNSASLKPLKRALQRGTPQRLELLVAALVGRLIGTGFSLASSGFQHGADAGTAGRGGRSLRIECKRYADDTPLDDRNLQGSVDDSLSQDPALEAWVLCATRSVRLQTAEKLRAKWAYTGVPTIFIDWPDDGPDLPPLAALCGWAPDIVEEHFGPAAGKHAARLSSKARRTVDRLAKELLPWVIGYDNLVEAARARVRKLWTDVSESRSALGQDVAVGRVPFIERKYVNDGLDAWWKGEESVVLVHGDEGMGKTWATFQWVHARLAELPIVLMLPASAFKAMRGTTSTAIVEFLGDALYELNPSTERAYWSGRVRRLLMRPTEDGPAFLLVVDGVNQEPSYPWLRLLQVLEAEAFRHRVRIVVTAQSHFLHERLNGLRSLGRPPRKIAVGPYDTSDGGEFDSLLFKHGLTRDALSADIIPLARIPRLFQLTIRLKAEAELQGEPTRARLLWAHARDELGLRANAALTENDWNEWLSSVASQYQDAIVAGQTAGEGYTDTQLGEMVKDPSGSFDETSRRLAEIVSGAWLEPVPGSPSRMRPKEATIQLALGIAILAALEKAEAKGSDQAAQVLDEYLDAVRAISEAAEILASALSVLVDKRWPDESVVPQLVLSALLNSQNATDAHRRYAVALAPALVKPLLYVVESSDSRAAASARHWALDSLQGISATNSGAWNVIVERLVSWVAHVECPSPDEVANGDESATSRGKHLVERIGVATPGTHRVLGVPLRLHEREGDDLGMYAPRLLLGKPLIPARKVLVAATVATSLGWGCNAWGGLWWLVMLNGADRDELRADLESLSKLAVSVQREDGVAVHFAERIGRRFLWLSGDEELERRAATASAEPSVAFTYEAHYLKDPIQSFFELERRHLKLVLDSVTTSPVQKLRRLRPFLCDPSLAFPVELSEFVFEWGRTLNLENLHSQGMYSTEEHNLEEYLPWAARIAPDSVADVVVRWLATFSARKGERRHWASFHVPHVALLAGPDEVSAMRAMRQSRPEQHGDQESVILLYLLKGELLRATADVQLDTLVQEKGAFISIQLADALRPPGPDTVASFVNRWGLENERAVEVLCDYLYKYPARLSDLMFEGLLEHALSHQGNQGTQGLAFMALAACEPLRFGKHLGEVGWSVNLSANDVLQEEGSRVLLIANGGEDLASIASAVAPWCLLEEAVARGGSEADMALAAAAIDKSLQWDGISGFPVVATISVDTLGRRNFIHVDESAEASEPEDFQQAFNPEARWEKSQAARNAGNNFLQQAKSAGALMATRVISLRAAEALLERCPGPVSSWLVGIDSNAALGALQELVNKINLAGGLFIALCEVLLQREPERGASLWHLLRAHLRIRFTGVGDLDQLLLMLFRAPENAAVKRLREHVYKLGQNPTDESLLHLALAATSQGASQWLRRAVDEDARSMEPFRQMRAITLDGFMLPPDGYAVSWPEGKAVGTWDGLRRRAQTARNAAVHARYWFRAFLAAPDTLTAFCSWHVFLSCADAMAWAWIQAEIQAHRDDSELWRLKMLHMAFNESELKSAIQKKARKGTNALSDRLVGQEKPAAWFTSESLSMLAV